LNPARDKNHGTDGGDTGPTFDAETSAAVARRVRARFRHCWHNAASAVHHLGATARYVEGWIVVGRADPYVIEHGWCEADGRIIDPSYAPQVSPYEPPLRYFAGLRFRASEAEAAFLRHKLPIAWSRTAKNYPLAFAAAWSDAARRTVHDPGGLTRVANCRSEPFDVFIGRPSKWQNPFHVGPDGTRKEVVAQFREWFIRKPHLLRAVRHLRGKTLGCHCPPQPCHGHVIAELANAANLAPLPDGTRGLAEAIAHDQSAGLPYGLPTAG